MKKGNVAALVVLFFVFFASVSASAEEKAEDGKIKKSGLVIVPLVFFTPETGWAGSIPLIYYYRGKDAAPDSRPSNLNVATFYSEKKQAVFQLAVDHFFKDEIYRGIGSATYSRYPQKFFGLGGGTSRSESEEYVSRYYKLEGKLLRKLYDGYFLGLLGEAENNEVLDPEEGGILETGGVKGSEGGVFTGIGVIAIKDTRDNVFYPTTGDFHQLSYSAITTALGGDFDYGKYSIDLRRYISVTSSQVLALQAYGDFLTGEPPFNRLAKVGGQNLMRGHFQGRYRDMNMLIAQGEYRMQVYKRLGLAGFAGVGQVAESIDDFDLAEPKYAVGGGIRYMLSVKEKINARLDFGWGGDDSGAYLVFLEAF